MAKKSRHVLETTAVGLGVTALGTAIAIAGAPLIGAGIVGAAGVHVIKEARKKGKEADELLRKGK